MEDNYNVQNEVTENQVDTDVATGEVTDFTMDDISTKEKVAFGTGLALGVTGLFLGIEKIESKVNDHRVAKGKEAIEFNPIKRVKNAREAIKNQKAQQNQNDDQGKESGKGGNSNKK